MPFKYLPPLLKIKMFDNEYKKKLLMIFFVFVLLAIFYYIFSPYETCMRAEGEEQRVYCTKATKW